MTGFFGFFAAVFGLPVPFTYSKILVYFLLWLVFFFGATILAPMVALMLNSVTQERRTAANSIATMAYNLFGYLPSPFIYGAVSDYFKPNVNRGQRVAIGVTLYWAVFAMIFLYSAMILYFKA